MPKLERWIIASKQVEVLDKAAMATIEELGGKVGGAWREVHQHICVTPYNKEQIEELLRGVGFSISYMSEQEVRHPEFHPECMKHHDSESSICDTAQSITVSKMLVVLAQDTMMAIINLGGHIGGGWCEVHQHVCVPPENREKAETLLREAGYRIG